MRNAATLVGKGGRCSEWGGRNIRSQVTSGYPLCTFLIRGRRRRKRKTTKHISHPLPPLYLLFHLLLSNQHVKFSKTLLPDWSAIRMATLDCTELKLSIMTIFFLTGFVYVLLLCVLMFPSVTFLFWINVKNIANYWHSRNIPLFESFGLLQSHQLSWEELVLRC